MADANMIQQINDAIGAHGEWKFRLRTAIRSGQSDITPATAGCDNQCAFGKWIHGPQIDTTTKTGIPYKVISRLHAEFHQTAGQVLSLAVLGEQAKAQELMGGEFVQRSEKLVTALTKWKRELS